MHRVVAVFAIAFVGCAPQPPAVVTPDPCPSGFARVGAACVNIGECAAHLAECAPEATCEDTVGGYKCTCLPGWEGTGKSCLNVNECVRGLSVCDANASCVDDPGTYHCACNAGFAGDGAHCAPIDRCAAGTLACAAHSHCENNACACDRGFEDDGDGCVDVTNEIRWPVPDSATSYCTDGTNVIGPPLPGTPSDGQDCTRTINPPKYELTSDVVRDLVTGLEWQRVITDATYTWDEATGVCDALVLGGHDDWRLPGLPELQSILDLGHSFPSLDPTAFDDGIEAFTWTATPALQPHTGPDHWYISFRMGLTGDVALGDMHARCVR